MCGFSFCPGNFPLLSFSFVPLNLLSKLFKSKWVYFSFPPALTPTWLEKWDSQHVRLNQLSSMTIANLAVPLSLSPPPLQVTGGGEGTTGIWGVSGGGGGRVRHTFYINSTYFENRSCSLYILLGNFGLSVLYFISLHFLPSNSQSSFSL